MVLLLDFRVDEVAVLGQFTDQRIHLTQCQLWPAFQKTTNETVLINAQFERGGTGILGSSDTELFCERKNAKDAANAGFSVMTMECFTKRTNLSAGPPRPRQQLNMCEWGFFGIVLRPNAVPAALLTDMLAEKLMRFRIENTDVQ